MLGVGSHSFSVMPNEEDFYDFGGRLLPVQDVPFSSVGRGCSFGGFTVLGTGAKPGWL